RREDGDFREFERRKNIPKQIDGEKRQQHEQLMDEFKRVHRKMFAHIVENEETSSCHNETSQLKISLSKEERESVKIKRLPKDGPEEKVTQQKTVIKKSETSTRESQGIKDVVKEVTIVSKKATDTPPPPPPMPASNLKNSNPNWKPSPASSINGSPPACPTPDYDTSSSISSSSSPHISVNMKPTQSHNIPTYATVNKVKKQVLNPSTNGTKPSQKSPKNNDSVEMQSIESFILSNPQSQKPRPPDTYFVVPEKKGNLANGSDSNQLSWRAEKLRNKPRPVSVTIGEYPTGVERRTPARFDFLPSHNVANNTPETDGSSINCKLQSELTQTLLRSNLKKKVTGQSIESNHNHPKCKPLQGNERETDGNRLYFAALSNIYPRWSDLEDFDHVFDVFVYEFWVIRCQYYENQLLTMPNIKLQSSDGEVFEVDVEIAKCSVTIKTMLEDLGMDEDEEEVVPLPNVNSAILKKVIQWATYHKDDPPPPEDDENKEKRTDDISSWDADFLKVDQGTLFELILAANYLDIKGLLDVTCKTVANMIKGKTPEEIRKTFNIKNDFTASEEEQVRKENEWCEEK
ncbi:hypothetical protein L9F63_018522, partial [Diploptera punctata]